MEKLNFAFKWEQVCREKRVCPSSAFGSVQGTADTANQDPLLGLGPQGGAGAVLVPQEALQPKLGVSHPCQQLEMDVEMGIPSSCLLALSWSPSW